LPENRRSGAGVSLSVLTEGYWATKVLHKL
jgi:hypothetical protein